MSIRMPRRRAGLLAVAPIAALIAVGAASPAFATSPVDGDHKVTFCHATSSAKNPYVVITTDKIAVVVAHSSHQDGRDVYPSFWYDDHGTPTYFQGNAPDGFDFVACQGGQGG